MSWVFLDPLTACSGFWVRMGQQPSRLGDSVAPGPAVRGLTHFRPSVSPLCGRTSSAPPVCSGPARLLIPAWHLPLPLRVDILLLLADSRIRHCRAAFHTFCTLRSNLPQKQSFCFISALLTGGASCQPLSFRAAFLQQGVCLPWH